MGADEKGAKGKVGGKVEFSERICKHMNDDHPPSVLAYARHYGGVRNATEATMLSMDLKGFRISCAVGKKEPAEITVPFSPPLERESEARKRIIKMHNTAMGPHLYHLFQLWALAPLVIIFHMAASLLNPEGTFAPVYRVGVATCGSLEGYQWIFAGAVKVHVFEAVMAVYFARGLSLPWTTSIGWFLLTILGGGATLSPLAEMNRRLPDITKKNKAHKA